MAAKANRLAGLLASPNPATQVGEIIERIPQALAELLVST
jgi:NAD(P)H-hydrate repair Nnr-like enzyme with NAD(P)H-hydrate dehydratase domain